MDSEQASAESQRSLGSSSFDSASSIKEREDIVNSLQDKIRGLLKEQKHNKKYKQGMEDFKKKIDQYRSTCKDLQEQLMEIIHTLGIPEDSPQLSVLEKIQNLKENEMLFQEINDIINDPNNTNKKTVIAIIKEIILFKQAISEILGKSKSTEELINDIKLLKKSKKIADSTLKELGTNNFEYLIENQKEIEQQQQQICSLLGIKSVPNKNARHLNIISALNDLIMKPSEILNEIGQCISPDLTEKIDDIQDVKSMINELKQKTNKLSKQNEKLTAELQNNKNSLSQFHLSNVDEVTSIISDLLSTLNIKSPAMIQDEISRKFSDRDKLEKTNKTISEELQITKSKFNETTSKLKIKEAECEENQSKLTDLQQKSRKSENEKNALKNALNDKEEEINSLKYLLQTEKGNVKLKFDEFNEQISSMKSDIRNLQSKNEELLSTQRELNSKNEELSNNLKNATEELESTKKTLKAQIESNNGLTEKVENSENQNEMIKSKLEKIIKEKDDLQKEFDSLEAEFNVSKQKAANLQKILNTDDSDQISTQIQVLLAEIEELKNSNKDLNKERQNVAKLLKLSNENSISEAISDLIEAQAEQKAENQDLTQKIAAIASFLDISSPQSATLATIQKTIRNLQKELETEQKEKTKLKNENDSMNQKYDVLLDTQNEIQRSLNMTTFQSSNELIKAVSENENLLSKAYQKLNVNKDDFLNKVDSNNKIVSELCHELNTDESNIVEAVRNNKKSIEKASKILNSSGSNIEKVIEDNNEIVNRVCKSLNCDKEQAADQVKKNCQVLNDLLKQADCEHIDQLSSEFKKTKQALNEAMNRLNINSPDKIASALTDLQKEADKSNEISNLMQISNGKNPDDMKHSIQNLLNENKRLNDTQSRIQTIMDTNDILNSVTLMSTVMNSIQKLLPKPTDINEIPRIFGRYQNDSDSYQKIQQLFPSRDPMTEINSLQKELNEIYSIFNLKKFDDPIELIKLNNDFVKSIIEIVNEFAPNGSSTSRRNRTESLNSSNNQELTNLIRKTFEEQKEIMKLLKSDSPLTAVKRLIDQKSEISQMVNLKPDEEPNEAIQKVVGLKNNLTSLFDVDEASDIFSTVQKQKQTNKDLFDILNVESSNQLISKAKELAEIECLIQKIYPDEKSLKEAILKGEKEKKEMSEFITKVSSLFKSSNLNSSSSSNSSNASSHSNRNGSSYNRLLKKIHKMAKIMSEVCQILNCSENSLIEKISKLKNDLQNMNDVFDSETGNRSINDDDEDGQTSIIQNAKKERQILKALKKTVDVNKLSEILPKVNQYQEEIRGLQEKLNQSNNFKSKLCTIFGLSNQNSPSSSSIEKRAEEFRTKLNQFYDLISLMKCNEDEVKPIILNLLSSTNSSSIKEISNFISSMRERIERFSQKIQKDTTILSEFLNDDDTEIQFMNSDNIVQLTMNKFKQRISSLEEKVARFDNEANRHANFIKNTSNQHFSLDEIASIFRSHEEQLKQIRNLFPNNNSISGSYIEMNDISMVIQKVEQLKQKLRETVEALSRSEQIINQRNFELSAVLSACNASSPEFAVDIINSLKKQVSELNKEVAELKTCQIVEESFRLFEKKEKKYLAVIASKLNEINKILQAILTSVENGRCQKAELKRLIEGALLESINLREKLEDNEEKWMLFGSKKKAAKKLTLSDEIRMKKKELADQTRKADKAEETVQSQKQQQQQQQIKQHKCPQTLL